MRSCLYECKIWHERNLPRHHAFTARHFMFYLALDELTSVERRSRLLGINRFNIFSFIESDYLGENLNSPDSLTDRVKKVVSRLGVRDLITQIDLLTNIRIFGYVFNPVSFYCCFGKENQLLCCLCEVGNTFGEKKVFLVEPDAEGLLRKRQKKFFYVSPFTNLDQELDFNISVPAEDLDIRIDTLDGDRHIVKASLQGRRIALNDSNLLKMLFRYPWATAKVIVLIHLHALILWLKKVPFHRKEEAMDMQLDVCKPKLETQFRTGSTTSGLD